MDQTPPTVPLSGHSAQRSSRTPFYVTVGCLSMLVGLVLGVGGFFGVRGLQGDDDAPPTEETTTAPTVLDRMPVGPDSAIPLGSTFPMESEVLEGTVDVTPATVDWDASDAIHEANAYNEKPEAGSKYIVLTVEGVYHGDGFEEWRAGSWLDVVYVAVDGTSYEELHLVTPRYDEGIVDAGVAEDGSFLSEHSFEVPQGLEPGGHFVLDEYVMDPDSGAWVEAA